MDRSNRRGLGAPPNRTNAHPARWAPHRLPSYPNWQRTSAQTRCVVGSTPSEGTVIEATVGWSRQAVTLVGPCWASRVRLPSITLAPGTTCPRGPTEKAAASYADECRFDSCRGHAPHSWLRSSVVEHPPVERRVAGSIPVGVAQHPRGCSSMAEPQSSKLATPVRFRSPARSRQYPRSPPAAGSWACGAPGSAFPLHGRGSRFDSDLVHVGEVRARVAQSGGSSSLIRNRSEVQILPRARIPGWSAGMADEVLVLGIVGSIPAPGALGFLAQRGERTGEDRDVGVRVPGRPRRSALRRIALPRWHLLGKEEMPGSIPGWGSQENGRAQLFSPW